MAMHGAASEGFRGAERYERARPEYPAEAIAWLASALGLAPVPPRAVAPVPGAGAAEPGPLARVVELGAGTGKLTRRLAGPHPDPGVRPGLAVVAVEPVAEMRGELAARVPGARVVGGLAEAIPLRSACARAVVCAQAFHWFASAAALAEIHRVLEPGGRLGLLWSQRDESVDWVRRLGEILEPLEGTAPRFRTGRWRDAFRPRVVAGGSGPAGGFGPLAEARFATEQVGPPEAIVDRVASVSFVAALPESRRGAVLEAVRRLLGAHPATAGRDRIRLPYVTLAFWCERR
jgi:SAM-dependent methyltransferase